MTIRERITYLYHHRPHPFTAFWKFAKGHLPRFQALRRFAAKHGFNEQRKVYGRKVRWLKAHRDPKPVPGTGNFVVFDGLQVPRWIVEDALAPARKAGVSFKVISGYRSPEYSESLCYGICGAPSCPGRCAGKSSNHCCPPTFSGQRYEGAVDVYPGESALSAWCQNHGNAIIGGGRVLPSDPNHFSRHGN